MSLILLTDIDGYDVAVNPDFIVSVTAVHNSYHGSKAVVRTQDGKNLTVRQTPAQVFAAANEAQQLQGEGANLA